MKYNINDIVIVKHCNKKECIGVIIGYILRTNLESYLVQLNNEDFRWFTESNISDFEKVSV